MERTGNTIGAEGRRQHNEEDPSHGDKHRRQERLADREIREGLEEIEESRGEEKDGDDAGDDGRAPESLETSPQADGVPDDRDVTDPEGTKPVTERRIEESGA